MNTDHTNETGGLDEDRLIEAINALRPGKLQQKAQVFQKLYPHIVRALARDVPQKELVQELKRMGLSLSVGGFRSLLDAERKRRGESGERICCLHCGSVLSRDLEVATEASSLLPQASSTAT